MAVRDARPADRAAIRDVVAAAFGKPAEADLVDRLRADGDSTIELVAAGFASPYAGPYLMALALNGPLPARTGTIVHAPAFAAL